MIKIQRFKMVLVYSLLPGLIVLSASTAIANESQDVIEKSIRSPSGSQLNLTIHNKDPLPLSNEKVFPDRKFILTAEYDNTTRQYITQKKSMHTNLTIFEPLTRCFNDTSHISSSNVMLSCVEEGFYVVGRVQTTSHKEQSLSQIASPLLFPNPVVEAYTGVFPAHTYFLIYKQYPDDPIALSDLNSTRHLYNAAPEGFVKFDSKTSEEEKPFGIKSLFKWLGWICKTIFVDINEDGDIDAYGLTFVTTD